MSKSIFNIAILGATSEIAKDLILSFAGGDRYQATLFARRVDAVHEWLYSLGLASRFEIKHFNSFDDKENFDALINFVGVGNPAQAASLGASIFDVTLKYDEMALSYLKNHPSCKYIFLSSGAAYGSSFNIPVDAKSKSIIDINDLQQQDWYGVSKLHAECRHRSLAQLPIIDIRIFNYFSHTQNMGSRFLITDIVRAIREKAILKTSADTIMRDYVGSQDFYQLIEKILISDIKNDVFDCYSKAPIDKNTLLNMMKESFGLQYQSTQKSLEINATGIKANYYSLNRRAEVFGYHPTLSSRDVLLAETELLLHGS